MGLKESLDALRKAGLIDPRHVAASTAAFARWGPTAATPYAAAAVRHPRRPAVVDHRGSISFRRLDSQSSALARGLRASGLRAGQRLGLFCRNHRDFVEANLAAAKAGMPVVYLNTGFAPAQLADVAEREGVDLLVADHGLLETVRQAGVDAQVVVVDGEAAGVMGIDQLRARGRRHPTLLTPRVTSPVLLTSGTTGTPKGAQRTGASVDATSALGILQRIPYKTGDVFVVACPLFHAWGLGQLLTAAAMGSTVVINPTFTAGSTLEAVAEHEATVLAVVPVMLQRILAEPALDATELESLRIVASSGSALPGPVALEWIDRVAPNLYNMYGSTEVGQATIADPGDLQAAPGTAGRVVPGSTVRILDDLGAEVATGAEGRIFVGNGAQFSGYTGGGTKEQIEGLMASGDVGYFDDQGRLFVTGRSDDMIISGGENVFPREVEDVLLAHADIDDVGVVGVDDADFGQRLAAFVVLRSGAELSADAVRSLVSSQLARHKVPRDVAFVDELPRTTTGKLLRRELVP